MWLLVWPVAIYGCETWTLKASDRKRISAFEMTSYRRMLRISCSGKSTEQTSPFWKKLEKKRDFWRTSNDGNCSFLGTRRERTTCARRSFMAGSVARNDEVVQEGDGQTTSETGWDHQSQNAQEWHRNVNYGEQWCRWAKSSTFSNKDDLVQSSPVKNKKKTKKPCEIGCKLVLFTNMPTHHYFEAHDWSRNEASYLNIKAACQVLFYTGEYSSFVRASRAEGSISQCFCDRHTARRI